MTLTEAIAAMTAAVQSILGKDFLSGFLYGSAVLDDFQSGWSDIDVLFLSGNALTERQAQALVFLRQDMLKKAPKNPYFRSFEGAVACWDEFRTGNCRRVVYWGTRGQRITDRYTLDPFSRTQLLTDGRLLAGKDLRGQMVPPTMEELVSAIRFHHDTIRQYAVQTDGSLYACGWLLDIARCIYTLRFGKVIAKTRAGEWALENRLCPDETALCRTLQVRRAPLLFRDDPETKQWLSSLGPTVQAFADVLEKELASVQEGYALPGGTG